MLVNNQYNNNIMLNEKKILEMTTKIQGITNLMDIKDIIKNCREDWEYDMLENFLEQALINYCQELQKAKISYLSENATPVEKQIYEGIKERTKIKAKIMDDLLTFLREERNK